MGSRSTTALVCAALVVSSPAAAQPSTDSGPYQVDWTMDMAVLGGATALWLVTPLLAGEVIRPTCPCASSALPGLDRVAVGRHSTVADQMSSVVGAGLTFVPLVADALDIRRSGRGWLGFSGDVVVLAEVVAVNGALNQLVKFAVRRPRPNVYDVERSNPEIDRAGNYLSFYSGHTSTAFAVGMFHATTFALRHPDSHARGLVYGAATAVAASVGLLRILAGQHFPSDVLAGAAVGSAVGLVVPRLHRRSNTLLVAPVPGGVGLMLTGRL
jgi:membrane-associated phospholipid phosphatase